MNRRTLLAAAAFVLGTMAVVGPADAQRRPERGWELLGTKKVGFIADRDSIKSGAPKAVSAPSSCGSGTLRSI